MQRKPAEPVTARIHVNAFQTPSARSCDEDDDASAVTADHEKASGGRSADRRSISQTSGTYDDEDAFYDAPQDNVPGMGDSQETTVGNEVEKENGNGATVSDCFDIPMPPTFLASTTTVSSGVSSPMHASSKEPSSSNAHASFLHDDSGSESASIRIVSRPSSRPSSALAQSNVTNVDLQPHDRITEESVEDIFNTLTSPTGIISETAIQETLQHAPSSAQDTGIGPGRIRKYADEGEIALLIHGMKSCLCVDPNSDSWKQHEKHFFVLSSAGKPIYARYGDETKLSPFMGVVQVIISFFQDHDDSIKYQTSSFWKR